MKYFLVKQEVNYADEFDVDGFWITEGESEEEVKKICLNHFENERFYNEKPNYPVECYFGTNEAVEFESQDDYLNSLNVEEITKKEYDVMEKIMPSFEFTF